jgi:hypothetical protein
MIPSEKTSRNFDVLNTPNHFAQHAAASAAPLLSRKDAIARPAASRPSGLNE